MRCAWNDRIRYDTNGIDSHGSRSTPFHFGVDSEGRVHRRSPLSIWDILLSLARLTMFHDVHLLTLPCVTQSTFSKYTKVSFAFKENSLGIISFVFVR